MSPIASHPKPILVVGSVALDTVETPSRLAERVVGGSAVFFSAAASLYTGVRVVAVVGDDYPLGHLRFLQDRGVDFTGMEKLSGDSFFWKGRYHPGLVTRDTLETRLGVFASFNPKIPPTYRDTEIVALGNIDPSLQLAVLTQLRSPRLIAADTMNFWIDRAPDTLDAVLARIDLLFLNEEEATQLSRQVSLADAARAIRKMGPRFVVIKRGNKGAVLFADGWWMSTPAFAVRQVVDPTGAGDAFAGGFLGYLATHGFGGQEELARAMVCGAVMGSFAVEDVSVDRFRNVRDEEIEERVQTLNQKTDQAPTASATSTSTGAIG